ncbi:MAG: response regulator [Roseofilum sp. SBFL]|uniref:response regulator n=1 Tax=Roseofilum sp. SBFL TaxID=2821496 RepID=UPI001B248619|nr:response regulator [Roseofilum sp. SBFL]MBP0043343.1 response regulator [Roseofilum sp. SBFL]
MDTYKGNILIVDDQLENLQVLSKTLSEAGYKVKGAVKGEMALRASRSGNLDLILLDIKLPDMNGYEICQELKKDEQTQNIPIVFLSALDEVLDKVRAFQVGGVDYITKPFQVEEVLARIEHQLTIRRLQNQLEAQNKTLQQEIQERKKAEEEAAAASKAKSQFLANMSHELRTPLNSILGFTQVMLRDYQTNDEQREYLEIINRSGEHLLDLIDDILDLSKIEAGIIHLNEKDLDIYYLLDGLEDLFEIKAESKNIHLEFNVDPQVPQYIKSDEQKLRSCLINLIGNAIKFTELGQVKLSVTLQQNRSHNGNIEFIEFKVSDTGPGIIQEEQQDLFKAFVQTSTGISSAQGTGLGLSITDKFVRLMGGEISVSSEVGKGTVFVFDIPLKLGHQSLPNFRERDTRQVVELTPNQKMYRVLVVDDTPENRKLLVKLLSPVGFEVIEGTNGQEAIALWQSCKPDLIFMDTRMPVVDGLEATRIIREQEQQQGLKSTVIIALTASAFEERRTEIIQAGSDNFICKPFKSQVIFNSLSRYLEASYIYETMPKSKRKLKKHRVRSDRFWGEQFTQMSPTWVQTLYSTAREVNEEQVEFLIQSIAPTHPALSEALTALFDNFRLDIIMQVTQDYLQRSP